MTNPPVALLAAWEKLVDALEFYATPDTYHAIAFLPDSPAGEFMEDFDEHHGDEFYDRPMPGQRARDALDAWYAAAGMRPDIRPGCAVMSCSATWSQVIRLCDRHAVAAVDA